MPIPLSVAAAAVMDPWTPSAAVNAAGVPYMPYQTAGAAPANPYMSHPHHQPQPFEVRFTIWST